MTTIILIAGFVFWSSIAFFGCQKSLKESNSPVKGPLTALKKLPGGLLGPVALGYLLGLYFVNAQVEAIKAQSGVLGPHFFLAVLCGIFASICLAGVLAKDD